MHEFGLDTTNNNPSMGTPLNPFSEEYYPGGSSGGSGSAVGCGVVPIALGTDGGGSVRVPSAYCGAFGLKPSHGRVSGWPLVNHCVSVSLACIRDLECQCITMKHPNDVKIDRLASSAPSQQPCMIWKYLTRSWPVQILLTSQAPTFVQPSLLSTNQSPNHLLLLRLSLQGRNSSPSRRPGSQIPH